MNATEQQVFFTPIDLNTPQDDAVRVLASLLYAEGVEDILALPIAISIFAGVQAALREGSLSAAIREWNPDTRPHLSGERRGHDSAEIERLKDVLHRDRSGLAAALAEVWRTAGGYAWVAEGRGPYAWDDEEYRREMARMVRDISTICQKALEASGDLAHAECCGRGKR